MRSTSIIIAKVDHSLSYALTNNRREFIKTYKDKVKIINEKRFILQEIGEEEKEKLDKMKNIKEIEEIFKPLEPFVYKQIKQDLLNELFLIFQQTIKETENMIEELEQQEEKYDLNLFNNIIRIVRIISPGYEIDKDLKLILYSLDDLIFSKLQKNKLIKYVDLLALYSKIKNLM